MQIQKDLERQTRQTKYALALVVGTVAMIACGIIVACNPASWINWFAGMAFIGVGVVIEEKYLLSFRSGAASGRVENMNGAFKSIIDSLHSINGTDIIFLHSKKSHSWHQSWVGEPTLGRHEPFQELLEISNSDFKNMISSISPELTDFLTGDTVGIRERYKGWEKGKFAISQCCQAFITKIRMSDDFPYFLHISAERNYGSEQRTRLSVRIGQVRGEGPSEYFKSQMRDLESEFKD
ncbi:hypothetical protein ACO0LB_17965 [Undibacterium sp. SXout7W]|uniref:hypothetical protein n=1 Tax=Undibacterium sp. SXout7W TaxID=3413049 RepID=UPI003BF0AB87